MSRPEFLAALSEGIQLVQAELDRRLAGEPGASTVEDLRNISNELLQVKRKVTAAPDPEPGALGCVRYIVLDTWPTNDPLGERLIDLSGLYGLLSS